jgi:hypothetical protein
VDVARSTFESHAGSDLVALVFANTEATLTNVTVAETGSTIAPVAVAANGAGAHSRLTVVDSTIAGTQPFGIYAISQLGADPGTAVCRLGASIVSGHGQQLVSASGTITSLGHNVISDATGPAATNGDLKSTDPLLGVLAYNGGPTPTFNLKPASPARDLVPLSEATPGMDQRAFRRPVGAAGDAGAVERVAGGDVTGDGNVNVADVFYLINYLFAGGTVPVGEADVNGDGAVGVADVFYLINFLFAGGAAPL